MEKFDLSDAIIKDTFAGRLLLGVITDVGGDKAIEVFDLQQHSKDVTIEIRFNGIEVPLSAFVNMWDRNRAWFAMKDLRELMKRRMGRVYDKVSTIERALTNIIRDEFPEFDQ